MYTYKLAAAESDILCCVHEHNSHAKLASCLITNAGNKATIITCMICIDVPSRHCCSFNQ